VLLANDTAENRNSLTGMSLRTFYAQGGSTPQQLTDLTSALRVLFDLRFVTPNAAQGCIVVRAPGPTLDAVARFLDDLRDEEPSVMLEVQVFEVSSVFTKDLGISTPDQFSVFNIPASFAASPAAPAISRFSPLCRPVGRQSTPAPFWPLCWPPHRRPARYPVASLPSAAE